MAIGSAPEIGVTFKQFGDLTPEQHLLWWQHVRNLGPDLMNGYGTLAYRREQLPVPPLAAGGGG